VRALVRAAWLITIGLLTFFVVLVAMAGGDAGAYVAILRMAVVAVVILSLLTWITRDARKASEGLSASSRAGEVRPDGDMSDVVGMPRRPPWMG